MEKKEEDSFCISSDSTLQENKTDERQTLLEYDRLSLGNAKDCGYSVDGFEFYAYINDCNCNYTPDVPKEYRYIHTQKCIDQSNDAKNVVCFAMRKNYTPMFLCRNYHCLLNKIDRLNLGHNYKNIYEPLVQEQFYLTKKTSLVNEFLQIDKQTALFVDIDFKNTQNIIERLDATLQKIYSILKEKSIYTFVCILSRAHAHNFNYTGLSKGSIHLTIRFYMDDKTEILFRDPATMIDALSELGIYNLDGVDKQVYPSPKAGHYFRSIQSIKIATNSKPVKSYDKIPLEIDTTNSLNINFYDNTTDKRLFTFPQYKSEKFFSITTEDIPHFFTLYPVKNTISVDALTRFCHEYLTHKQIYDIDISDASRKTLTGIFAIIVKKYFHIEADRENTIFCKKPFGMCVKNIVWEHTDTIGFANLFLKTYYRKLRKFTTYDFVLDIADKDIVDMISDKFPLTRKINNDCYYTPFVNGIYNKDTGEFKNHEEMKAECLFTYKIQHDYVDFKPTKTEKTALTTRKESKQFIRKFKVKDISEIELIVSTLLFSKEMLIVICKNKETVQFLSFAISTIYSEVLDKLKTAKLENLKNEYKQNTSSCVLLKDKQINLKQLPYCEATLLIILEETTTVVGNTLVSVYNLDLEKECDTSTMIEKACFVKLNFHNYESVVLDKNIFKHYVFDWLETHIEYSPKGKLSYCELLDKYNQTQEDEGVISTVKQTTLFKRAVNEYICKILFFNQSDLHTMKTHKNSENIAVRYWIKIKFVKLK